LTQNYHRLRFKYLILNEGNSYKCLFFAIIFFSWLLPQFFTTSNSSINIFSFYYSYTSLSNGIAFVLAGIFTFKLIKDIFINRQIDFTRDQNTDFLDELFYHGKDSYPFMAEIIDANLSQIIDILYPKNGARNPNKNLNIVLHEILRNHDFVDYLLTSKIGEDIFVKIYKNETVEGNSIFSQFVSNYISLGLSDSKYRFSGIFENDKLVFDKLYNENRLLKNMFENPKRLDTFSNINALGEAAMSSFENGKYKYDWIKSKNNSNYYKQPIMKVYYFLEIWAEKAHNKSKEEGIKPDTDIFFIPKMVHGTPIKT